MNNWLARFLMVLIFLVTHSAFAEDIDLFVRPAPATASQSTNLLLLIDNAANFSASAQGVADCIIDGKKTTMSGSVGGVEQCALYNVFSALAVSDTSPIINVGVMMYNESGMVDYKGNACPLRGKKGVGGCLVFPVVPLTTTNKTALLSWIKNWNTSGGAIGNVKGNGQATGALMQEAWAYLKGRTGLSGADYASVKPISGCGNNYVMFIGNAFGTSGSPGDSTGDVGPKDALEGTNTYSAGMNAYPAANADQKALITNTVKLDACGATEFSFPTTNHEQGGFYADEWARYMATQDIVTYTIGIVGSKCKPIYPALLTSMASEDAGNGKYFQTTNYQELAVGIETILSEVQSKDSVFASVSLPVSVNTQGTFLNQVYVGMFRPADKSEPRWNGNLKQYKLGKVGDSIKLLDADDKEAISSSKSGFIAECARSFWTPTSDDSYWDYTTENCTGHSGKSNTPDGNVVEKGAQGYMLRSLSTCTTTSSGTTCKITTPRNVKTCSPSFASCTALTTFNTSNSAITQSMLDSDPVTATTPIPRDTLINWAIGLDMADENGNQQTTTEMRRSVHGDVVHSRPVALNYGTDAAPQVVVFYGANDGMLRAVNGNRTSSITSNGSTYPAGSELWSFMPPEFYSSIKRLYNKSPAVSYEGGNIPESIPKSYGMDGPVTAYKDSTNAWVYATMRRGGRVLYAFDVKTPGNPSLKWKQGCPNNFPTTGSVSDSDCTSGFSGIGQTWSAPKTLRATGYDSGNSPLLVMGGGYDTCEDSDPANCSSPKGNHVYVMDANTGALKKTLDTDRSVVGDVNIVRDTNGLAQYVYATDTGGNIYRITIGSNAPENWTITKIASLGCDTAASCTTANRKFLFGPDVVVDGDTNYVLVGSGDREKPLQSYAAAYDVKNYFFMVKDKPQDTSWLSSQAATCDGYSVICLSSLFLINSNATPTDSDLASKKGWYLALAAHEQVVTSSVSLFGVTTFSTHVPTASTVDTSTCESTLGKAYVYNIQYKNAKSANKTDNRYQLVDGGGLSPSPTAGVVTLDDGSTEPFVIGADPNSPLEGGGSLGSSLSVTQPKGRVFWYLEQ